MVTQAEIDAQLRKIGVRKTRLSAPEIKQLQHILIEGEQIVEFVSGRYHGGFAVLVATPRRLLLVDKKPLYLTVDDIRYDMIAEIDATARLFDATLTIHTINKQHAFTSIRQSHLRSLASYVQKRVMEVRNYEDARPVEQVIPRVEIHETPAAHVAETIRSHLPHPHLHKAVGSLAVATSNHLPRLAQNPYTRGSVISRSIIR